MLALLLQAPVVASDPATILQGLRNQDVRYSVQVSTAERQQAEAAKAYEKAVGAQKEIAGTRLTESDGRVASARMRLTEVRERMGQVQREIAISTMGNHASAGVVFPEDQNRVLGLRPTDFEGALIVLIVFPIVAAITRWIWRRGPARGPVKLLDGSPQLARLEQAVESIAIEVERIGEAQRFSAKLLSERPVQPVKDDASQRRAKRPVITPVP